MDIRFIHEEDWIEFERRYSAAWNFLLQRSLTNELLHLRRGALRGRLNIAEKCRLLSLEEWAKSIGLERITGELSVSER